MKLTKGKINKFLLKNSQSKKKYNSKKICKIVNTYKKKQPFNLKNKTIKNIIYK